MKNKQIIQFSTQVFIIKDAEYMTILSDKLRIMFLLVYAEIDFKHVNIHILLQMMICNSITEIKCEREH